MTPQEFIVKWQAIKLSERSACQQHFLDLCDLLGQPKPAAADPEGAWYCFERGVSKTEGGNGWADVWMKGHFGWEYKGKHKDLKGAYTQLLQYRESLENPPLLVVCDMDRFEIHTNFTGTAKRVFAFDLEGLADPQNLDKLRRTFTDPDSLRPGKTSQSVTEEVAEQFGKLADGMRARGVDAHDAAHFLMKLMFCMFAEDIDLLGGSVFSRAVAGCKKNPAKLTPILRSLFEAMATGGMFGADEILYFNGGLFSDSSTIEMTPAEIELLGKAAEPDWSVVEPHIFGTLFERTIDPAKRAQIGAHYTGSDDIRTLLEPVMMAPLRREWEQIRSECEELATEAKRKVSTKASLGPKKSRKVTAPKKGKGPQAKLEKKLRDFVERLAHVTVLDPACGSGNFLYMALRLLLDLEKEVITFAARQGLGLLPQVRPTQLHGIEINPFAHELAQVVIWIGYLQWMRDNGFMPPRNPVLDPIDSIENRDAILDLTDPENPKEPDWPEAEFIVGNPPFLGDKMMRSELGDEYVSTLRELYKDRLPGQSDLCCYWFELSRAGIERGTAMRAGLLATQGIRGGANRRVLERIKQSGDVFFCVTTRQWVLDGANVHISMVGFDGGHETVRTADGRVVKQINPDLTSARLDLTTVRRLNENSDASFQGPVKVGRFDIADDFGQSLLQQPNPNGKPTSDVVRPWLNGEAITKREPPKWIVDFHELSLDAAAGYAAPFEYVRVNVKPERDKNRREKRRKLWWVHGETNNALRNAVGDIDRMIGTCQTAKHRIFVWMDTVTLPAQTVIAISHSDNCTFGVLQSRLHLTWALKLGTHLETRPRYTPTTCFETFPFPHPSDEGMQAIAAAAKALDQLRTNWLNPPEWTREEILEFPGSTDGPWRRFVHDADNKGIGTVRYPRIVPKDEECAKHLKKRTLTNLYNERPTWLDLAHKKLDAAVFAAYGWPDSLSDDALLAKLLELNLARAKEQDG